MKIDTALILCAGFGKRLNPITLDTPKPLLELNNVALLETCINLIENLGIRKIIINTFYLGDQISNFIKNKNFISKIKIIDEGKTILLTTHYIEEAEMLCDKVAIIDSGKVITEGSPKELIGKDSVSGITIFLSESFQGLENILNDYTFTRDDKRVHFSTKDPEGDMPKIIRILSEAGAHVQRIETDKSSLEDVFLNLTGKGINK